jgi:hypothetical protein
LELFLREGKPDHMAIVTVRQAKTQLSKLIARAEAGRQAMKGVYDLPNALFFDPLADGELKLYEGADGEAPPR